MTANSKWAAKALLRLSAAVAVSTLGAPHALAQAAQAAQSSDEPKSSADQGLGDEIVVTAQRRQESIQQVPIAVSAFSGEFVRDHVTVPEDVAALTPNFQMTGITGGVGLIESFSTIRGIGSNDQNNPLAATSILTYYDGLASGTSLTSSVPPWDLSRVEVARGPQGTLFGRNAAAGLVQYISETPTNELKGYAQFSVGQYDLRRFEGAIGGPLSDNLKVRLSGMAYQRGGDVRNVFLNRLTGEKDWWGVRGIIDWQPLENTTIRLKAQHFEGEAGRTSMNAAPRSAITPNGLAFLQSIGQDPELSSRSNFEVTNVGHPDQIDRLKYHDIVELDLNHDFGPATLSVVGGYLTAKSFRNFDSLDYGPLYFDVINVAGLKQWSGEVRLTSNNTSPLQWIAGAYYQRTRDYFDRVGDFTPILRDLDGDGLTRYNANSPEDLFDGITPNPAFRGVTNLVQEGGNSQRLNTYAFFLHTTYDWTDEIRTTHSIRFTRERKQMDYRFLSMYEIPLSLGVVPGSLGQHNDVLAFALLSPEQQRRRALRIISDPNSLDASGNVIPTTFKDAWNAVTWKFGLDYRPNNDLLLYASVSKGFRGGIFSIFTTPATARSADPETNISYEVGAKTEWFDRRLRINVAAFYMDYKNYQTTLISLTPQGGLSGLAENLPKTRIYGAELEMTARPVDGLLLNANLGVANSKITKVLARNESLLGNELPFAEDLNVSGLARYDIHTPLGTFSPEIAAQYTGKYWSKKENNDVTGKLGGFWTVDLSLGFESAKSGLYGRAYVRNVFDEVRPVLNNLPAGAFLGVSTASTFNERRNWGLMVGYRF